MEGREGHGRGGVALFQLGVGWRCVLYRLLGHLFVWCVWWQGYLLYRVLLRVYTLVRYVPRLVYVGIVP